MTPKMQTYCLGLNHRSASLDLRERFSWDGSELRAFLREQMAHSEIQEIAVLSTCNRMELYFAAQGAHFERLLKALSELSGVSLRQLEDCTYQLSGEESISHLFRVAAGLDSLVVGEPQILGQVSRAYEFAQTSRTSGKELSKLFQAALSCGKRVQTETKINQFADSIPSLAVKLAVQTHPQLDHAHVMLIGAGEMAELAVGSFRKRGVEQFTVVSRTLEHAEELAQKWGGRAAALANLPRLLEKVDIVLSSTSAQDYIITRALLKEALAARHSRPLLLLDIAVPRDVEPTARRLRNVRLYDMEDLEQRAAQFRTRQKSEVQHAEEIVEHEVARFREYAQHLTVSPLIKRLRHQAEEMRRAELEKALQRLSGLSPSQQRQVNQLTRSIVNKILHEPTMQIRHQAAINGGGESDYFDWVSELFGLSEEQKSPE